MRNRGCLIALLLLVVLIVAAAVWTTNYMRSPEYSLFRLTLAANTGDWAEVQTYADVDAITNRVASLIVREQVEDMGIDLGNIGDRLADAAVPAVAEQLEQQVRAQVVARRGRRNTPRDIAGAFYFANRADVVLRGDRARVRVALPILGKRRATQLRMEQAGPVWRVVQIENIARLVRTE